MPLILNPPSEFLSLKEGSTNRGGRALKSARLLLKSLAALIPLAVCGASHAESAPSEQYHGPGASPFSAKRALQTENPWIARAMQDDAFVIRQRLPYDRVDMPQANKPNQVGGGVELAGSERFINLIDLNWRQHPSGHYAAVIAYTLEQARALRIALSLEGFPKGLTVKFVDADPATAYPAASLDHAKASELLGRGLSVHWSPIIAGETLHIELNHPDILEAGFGDARIELPGMSYLYAEGPWGRTPAPGPAQSGALKADGAGVVVPKAAVDSCAVDVSCPTPGITDRGKDLFSAATAYITYTKDNGRSSACTGHLLNDRDAATSKPYLLTANHCVGSENVAATVVAYWDYRAPSCGGDIARRQSPTTQGSELLATRMQQDWTLLILGSERNPAVLPGRRAFLGWDPAPPSVGERLHHIGHSAARPQSYASGRIASVGNNYTTLKNMLRVNLETGLTAGGVSGSVLVNDRIQARTGGLQGGVGGVCESLGGGDYGAINILAPFSLVFPHIRRFLGGNGDTPPGVPGPDGHGGTRGSASILNAGSGGVSGDIGPGDDIDYFRFTIPAGGPDTAVTVYTTGGLDTVGRLEDSAGDRLSENDDAGDGSNFRMEAVLPPGDYHVRVESRGDGTGAYRLHLEFSYLDHHGGTRGGATIMTIILDAGSGGAGAIGGIAPGDDVDYFRFTIPDGPGAVVTAYTTGGLDTVGRLEGGAGARLAEDDDGGDEFNFRMAAAVPPGDYYVRVESYGGGIGAYRLHLEFSYSDGHGDTPPGVPGPDRHGGTRGGATILDAGSGGVEAAGDIAPGDDIDYFRFTIPDGPGAVVTAYATGGLDTVGVLEDSAGARLAANDDGGDGLNFRMEATLPPGDYYVRVESYGGGTDAYRLHLEVSYPDGHGDTRGGATILDAGSGGADAAGDIAPGSDIDSFRFTVPAGPGAAVTAYTTGGLDTVGVLEDSAGARLAANDDAGDQSNFRIKVAVAPGDYYVRVESYGGGTGAYRLHLEVMPDTDGHQPRLPRSAMADFDGGGAPDILLRNKGGAWWLYGLDGGRIVSSGPVPAVSNIRWVPQSLADFDGDGKADLLIRNLDTGAWWLYLMDGNAVAAQGRVAMTGDRAWRPEAFTDTNGDGAADVILRHAGSGRWWRYGLSGIGVIESGELKMARDQEYRALAFRDFNGDGRTDAVLRHKRSGRWLLYALDGDEAIGSALLANRDLAWVPQAFEDFNGDGRADLLLRNLEAGNWWLYTLNGNAIETSGPVRATRDFGWRPVAFADLDGNGAADMILRHADGAWWTYLMDGGRVVGGGRLSANRDRNWRPVAAEDFDGDGRADLLLRNLEAGSWWLYRLNGNLIETSGPVGATRDRRWGLIE